MEIDYCCCECGSKEVVAFGFIGAIKFKRNGKDVVMYSQDIATSDKAAALMWCEECNPYDDLMDEQVSAPLVAN